MSAIRPSIASEAMLRSQYALPTKSTSTSTPTGSVNGGSSVNTPLTSMSAATSQEDLSAMAKLQIATDRCVLS